MMVSFFERFFLEERSSISLSAFRIAVALTVGVHVLPTFCHLSETYLSTAFKTYNTSFFPVSIVQLVQKTPDGVVPVIVGFFCVFWFLFLIGLKTQISCIMMTLVGYYFYALNSFHVGTLSWDILQVTLFLMCITPYSGDYFSVDAFVDRKIINVRNARPYFAQRLLQLQIGFTYFYTAVYKTFGMGNWFQDNPVYYLMNYPIEGVMKTFILKDYLMSKPGICYILGVMIVITEFLMIFMLFYRKTRTLAICLGVLFHFVLVLTMDVPAIFFFLFPPQLLLFIDPEKILSWAIKIRIVPKL